MTTTTKKRGQNRALPWFGADTSVAQHYAEQLRGCRHVTIPFAGGLSIVRWLVEEGSAQEIVCNDLHHHAINLYRVLSHPGARQQFLEALEFAPFHVDVLRDAQFLNAASGDTLERAVKPPFGGHSVLHAVAYWTTAWMGRGGKCGTSGEERGDLPVRWNANGGASPKRWASSLESVRDLWGPICERCSFLCEDALEIVGKALEADRKRTLIDVDQCGIYLDPPWVKAGGDYVHKFTVAQHRRLAELLTQFERTRIVLRYGDDELVRELYPSRIWTITRLDGTNQANVSVPELLITRIPFRG